MADQRTRTPGVNDFAEAAAPVDVPVARAPAAIAQAKSEPTYSDSQVAAILQRTAQLERGRLQQKPELSLAEVEQIARESGLDPSLVRVAARSLEETAREETPGARLIGEPTSRTFERVIDGELSLADHEAIGGELLAAFRDQSTSSNPPQLSTLGRSLMLTVRGGAGIYELSLSPREGKTLLKIGVNVGALAGGFFAVLGVVGGVGMMPMVLAISRANSLGVAATVLGCAGLFAGTFGLARTLYAWRARKVYARVEKIADTLESQVREAIARRK